MSPRRKIGPDERSLFFAQSAETGFRRRVRWFHMRREGFRPHWPHLRTPRWGLPIATTAAVLVTVAAITACTLMLISHETHRRAATKDKVVLTYVRSFMTGFTSPDPFHANDYVDRVLAQATGEFAKQYQDKANWALLRVARAEPTTGTVLDAGVARWNDDGSANVLVATEVTSKSRDGKNVVDGAYRWVVTAKQEGDQWKISNLVQVI